MQELRQSTEVKVRIGSAVDVTDGVTPETTLALGTADQAELLKHNGVATVDISARTFAAVTACDGWYDLTLTTTDTNTLGQVTVVIQDSSLMAPIFRDFMVVTANYWDSKYSTDKLQVDLIQIGGVAQSATDLKDFADAGYDPTPHKVQGVVLTDTCTTNTDMVGTANAAPAATALSDATWTNAKAAYLDHSIATVDTVADGIQTDLSNATDGLGALKALIDTVDGIVDNILTDTGTTLENHLTDIKGTGFVKDTDSLPQCLTATGFSTHSAANVWAVATRILTANTNFNDLDAAAVKAEVVAALADIKLDHLINIAVDTNWATTVHLDSVIGHLADVGTAATFDRTADALEAIRNRGDAAWVTATGFNTTTPPTVTQIRQEMDTNSTKMAPSQVLADYKATGFSTHSAADVKTAIEAVGSSIALILADTNELQTDWVNGGRLDLLIDAILTDTGTTLDGKLDTILGLNQENFYIDTTVFTGANMTSCRIRLYSVAGSVGTASDVIATYTMTATYAGDNLASYKMVKA